MLINKLISSGRLSNDAILINEFTVDKAERRVDIALITENYFEAFEIKSEADSLSRLSGQTSKYLEYFDKVTIISAKKHSNRIQDLLNENIGLWEINNNKFKVIKRGRKKTVKEKQKIINLMTASELKSLAIHLKIKATNNKRQGLELALFEAATSTLRKAAFDSIKNRYSRNYSVFSKKTEGRSISSEDLQFLRAKKNRVSKNKEEPSIESLILSIDSTT